MKVIFLELFETMVTNRTQNQLTQINTGAAGSAGEYYALSNFIRMGYIAGKAPEGTALYDLIVMTPNGYSFAPVQVKTVTNGEHWLMRQSHETSASNLIFCFVKFGNSLHENRIFLLPSIVVCNAIRMGNEIWMALPGRDGIAHTATAMRTFKTDYSTLIANTNNPEQHLSSQQLLFIKEHSNGWLDQYEDNFDIFRTE